MNRADLVKTLELVKPALATNNMVPIFQNFIFRESTVSAYDDAIAIVGPTECEDSFGVHGNTLLGLLSSSKVEEVEFDFKDQEIILQLGKSVSKLPTTPKEDFIFEEPTGKWNGKIPFTASLVEALELCLETVSSDATQKALHGITIQDDTMYSCNGDTLTRVRLKTSIGKKQIFLPTEFCEAVTKLWSEISITVGDLAFNDEWLFANFEDWSVYGRVLEIAEPIDFEDLIKRTVKSKVTLQELPEDFSDALSRARVLADAESKQTSVTVAKGRLKLLTETPMGEVKEDLSLKGHPDVITKINASHLAKAIGVCDKIAFHENCTVLERVPDVFQLVSNMG
jgi:DNA polymerase III sliding clamp (beta) subunit (PCNA family)